ncbi:MAG: glucose-1-phosphate thymidylyltransferase RfbA [Verrucomicrobiota bacterium]|nr:glucose-1-phosphate thymidylyltransferase RfbA [Verrucomicrobiota bacterium]
MYGIILAGGSGTRLHPLTKVMSKQLLPVYDKPMIYYPLSTLMMAGIREILIISTKECLPLFNKLLGNGEKLGLSINYAEQLNPDGLAQAFIIGKKFIGNDNVAMILGDNIFSGNGFSKILNRITERKNGATIFAYQVVDPERYGIVSFNKDKKVISIEEKPINPKSNYAIPGLYFYDNDVINFAESLKPSKRGELEISDLNLIYLDQKKLHVEVLDRGFVWLDTGTNESLHQASSYIETVEKRQGIRISCIEEIAYNLGYISDDQLLKIGKSMESSDYGKYLIDIVNG